MSTNFKTDDVTRGAQLTDLDDRYVTESWLIDRFTQGTLFAWGDNVDGQLGVGDTIRRSSPIQVGNTAEWAIITAGSGFSYAIKNDGSLWSWGNNSVSGMLGLGDLIDRSTPVQVGSLNDWKYVDSGNSHLLAVKKDGSLWGIGLNNLGQLGLGATDRVSSPIQVGSLYNWKSVACGTSHSIALSTDGSIWSTGQGAAGKLGLGDTVNRSTLTQIGTSNNWKLIRCGRDYSLAINNLGELWGWGDGGVGSFGIDINVFGTNLSTPVISGSISECRAVSAGSSHTLAIRNNGSMWASGFNGNGELGTGDLVHRSSFVQIGSQLDWKNISAGSNSISAAIKNNGSLWLWGSGEVGQLGFGDTVHRSSPTQLGSSTNWKLIDTSLTVSAERNHVLALTYKE